MDSFEFHARLNVNQFCGHSNPTILLQRMTDLVNDIFNISGGIMDFDLETYEIYYEDTKYLTLTDGMPFPVDLIENPVYRGPCAVRIRESMIIVADSIQDTMNTTSFEMNGIIVETFPKPEDIAGIIECDVYQNGINVAFTLEKSVNERPNFSDFRDVLDIFDIAGDFFDLPLDYPLSLGDAAIYGSKHYSFPKSVAIHGIAGDCAVTLEYGNGNFKDALMGRGITDGEIACQVIASNVGEDGVKDALDYVRDLFTTFSEKSEWAA